MNYINWLWSAAATVVNLPPLSVHVPKDLSLSVPSDWTDWSNVRSLMALKKGSVCTLEGARKFVVDQVLQHPDIDRLTDAADPRGIGGVWSGDYDDGTGQSKRAVIKLTMEKEEKNHRMFCVTYPENVPRIYHSEKVKRGNTEPNPKASTLVVMELVDAVSLCDERHVADLWKLLKSILNGTRKMTGSVPMYTDVHGENVLFRRDDGRPILIDFDGWKNKASFDEADVGEREWSEAQRTALELFWELFVVNFLNAEDVKSTLASSAKYHQDPNNYVRDARDTQRVMKTIDALFKRICGDGIAPRPIADIGLARRWWFRGLTLGTLDATKVNKYLTQLESTSNTAMLSAKRNAESPEVDASLLPYVVALTDDESAFQRVRTLLKENDGAISPVTMFTMSKLHAVRRDVRLDEIVYMWRVALMVFCEIRLGIARVRDRVEGDDVGQFGRVYRLDAWVIPSIQRGANACLEDLKAMHDGVMQSMPRRPLKREGDPAEDPGGKRAHTQGLLHMHHLRNMHAPPV